MTQQSPSLARSAVLDGFIVTARSLGLDPDSLLRDAGIASESLQDADQTVPMARIITLLENASVAAGNPSFGLLMAQARRFSVLGPVALVMREQPDLRRAITSLSRLGWAQAEGLDLTVEDDGETAILTLTLAPGLPRPATQSIELSMAAIVRMLRHFLGPAWSPQMMTFSHRRPAVPGPYARLLGVTPIFRFERNSIVLLSEDLDRPIADADPVFGRQLERLVETIGRPRTGQRQEQVRASLAQLLPTGQCSATRIAALFGVDRRTLHRWLEQEGTSYARLLEDHRRRLCAQYRAEASHSLTEIAGLLGFASLSAYARWRRALIKLDGPQK